MRLVPNLLTLLLASAALPCPADTSLPLHESHSLDGDWRIIVDPYESGFYDYRYNQRDKSRWPNPSETFYLDTKPRDPSDRVEYDFDLSPVLHVPGDWNTQREDLFYYEGTVWYRKKFDAPKTDEGDRLFLRFGAANYRADVYLNGQKLGVHRGGFTPFAFEVTGRVKPEGNSLVVRVDNKRHKSAVPTLNTDWWNYGGLTRSVELLRTPAAYVSDHRLSLDPNDSGVIVASATVDGAESGREVTLTIPELGVETEALTDAEGTARFRVNVDDLIHWSPEQPKLYECTIACGNDQVIDRVGFRTIATRGKELLLNGEPVFLRGISIHEEYPLEGGGRVNSPEKARQLLAWAKELGCNFVRLAHYPHNEDMVRLADEMGVLVWSEVPVYWTIDWENPDTYSVAEQQVVEMIRRDVNRPSVIIWSLANETPTSDARTRFLAGLAAKARELDGTRLISAAMEKHNKRGAQDVSVVEDALADLVDIVSFNQYTGWYDGLPDKCARVSWEIPYDKPVFVSEFGGGAKQGLHGERTERWTEEYQADLYRQTLPMLEKIDGWVGCTPWVLVDFRSPKRVLPGVQDGFNRKGLISEEGVKKQAFSVLQEYYQQKAEESSVAGGQ